jgi:phospholipid/cholesterol/gamma-HCH transport system permease protein
MAVTIPAARRQLDCDAMAMFCPAWANYDKIERRRQELQVTGGPTLEQIAKGDGLALCAAGPWTARFAGDLEQIVAAAEALSGSRPHIFIDVSQVSKLDTFGAWLIERLRRSLTSGDAQASIAGLSANYSTLVDEVRKVKADPAPPPVQSSVKGAVEAIGRAVYDTGQTLLSLIDMMGAVLRPSCACSCVPGASG